MVVTLWIIPKKLSQKSETDGFPISKKGAKSPFEIVSKNREPSSALEVVVRVFVVGRRLFR
jgi:hypothetical protein